MTTPEQNRRRADKLRALGAHWVPPHTVRTYGLFRGHKLVAMVVSSAWDSVFQFTIAGHLGYRVLMLVEYDITKVPGGADRLRQKIKEAGHEIQS